MTSLFIYFFIFMNTLEYSVLRYLSSFKYFFTALIYTFIYKLILNLYFSILYETPKYRIITFSYSLFWYG